MLPRTPRFAPHRRRAVAAAVAVVLAGGTLAAIAPVTGASAETYPSWSDVQQAKASQAAQQAKVSEIEGLIADLDTKASAARQQADAAGTAYQTAQTKYDEATLTQQTLQAQADDAAETAKRSEAQAGALAAQLGRASSQDVTTDILTHPSGSGDLLYELGTMSKLTEQADGIYADASQDRGVAQGLADKARSAKEALGALAQQAQSSMQAAQRAADDAQSAVDAQNDNEARLQAQLVLLTTNEQGVEADYEKGVAAEQARKAALAEAARKATQAAAQATPSSQGGSGGGAPNGSGWVRPSGGYQTSAFGMRVDPYTHKEALHAGVDLAPACSAPIYAAHAGRVTFAANGGGYGNEVVLDNGGGISTAYGHIVDGGILVSVGQQVQAGQQIAMVGSTGWSTGCHLHFETRVGGSAVDPVPFMAARGISV